jgi:FAD synthetase
MKAMKKIATFGVFDLIHPGHVKFLEKCKNLAEDSELTVVIARDSTVIREKGKKPIMSEERRRHVVKSLKPVDRAILGNEGPDKLKIVEKIKPDIIVLGYDQPWNERELKKELEKRGLKIQILRFEKLDNVSSTSIKNSIKF